VLTVVIGTYGEKMMSKVNVSPQKVKVFSAGLLLVVGAWILVYFASGLA